MKAAPIIFAVLFCIKNGNGLTGGEPADDGEFPFMVSIRGGRDNCHFCGGTIIGERWIMTSNACYSGSWGSVIKFGSNKLENASFPGYGRCTPYNASIQRHIDDVLYNPKAEDRPPWTHDLVLLHLNESILFGENVQPVQLPEVDEPWPDYQTGIMAGWGSDNFSDYDEYKSDLYKAQVPLFSDEYCFNSSLWDGWMLTDPAVMKCGGEINKTYYCRGDHGGPLLVDGKQFGIISYIRGETCGRYLGIFSPVSYFREWIRDTTGI